MSKVKVLFAALAAIMVFCLQARAEPRDIRIGWLMIMDWDSDFPEAPTCLRDHPDRPSNWNITFEAVYFDRLLSGEQVITDYDLVVTTGHESHTFSAEERTVLETYLDAGGTLWFDDCGQVEVDNLPFGMEINFGCQEYPLCWGTCYGDYFTIDEPDHPLVSAVYPVTASMMRNDAGLSQAQWFTPPWDWDPRYTTVITGNEVTGAFSGPFLMAARVSSGRMAASFGDVTCALECVLYGNTNIPLSDYYWVYNLIGWVDSDADNIEDHVEGAYEGVPSTTPVDTDGDTISDYMDVDTDGDGVLDIVEAGDEDLDTPPVDTDGDGTPDFRDDDSDGDTIPDGTEERADANRDGLPDPDADGDGVPNRIDADSDNDGNPDSVEGAGDVDGDGIPNFVDADDSDGPVFTDEGAEPSEDADTAPDAPADGTTDGAPDGVPDGAPDTLDTAVPPDYLTDSPQDGQGDAPGPGDEAEAGCGCALVR